MNGITFEADLGHAEIIISQLKFQRAKVVSTPGANDEGSTSDDCHEPLDGDQATQDRAIVARCNYIAPDKPYLAFSVKEFARHMAKPTRGDWQRLKRLGRYLVDKPRMRQTHPWQGTQRTLKTYTDADWAGCRESRKSTTGGCATLGSHTLKGWSKTHALIALSFGESEFYAALKASVDTLGLISLLKDLGYNLSGEVWADPSAALGISNRRGLGKSRHIEIGFLWVQQIAAEKMLKYHKVLGAREPSRSLHKILGCGNQQPPHQEIRLFISDGTFNGSTATTHCFSTVR